MYKFLLGLTTLRITVRLLNPTLGGGGNSNLFLFQTQPTAAVNFLLGLTTSRLSPFGSQAQLWRRRKLKLISISNAANSCGQLSAGFIKLELFTIRPNKPSLGEVKKILVYFLVIFMITFIYVLGLISHCSGVISPAEEEKIFILYPLAAHKIGCVYSLAGPNNLAFITVRFLSPALEEEENLKTFHLLLFRSTIHFSNLFFLTDKPVFSYAGMTIVIITPTC